MVGAIQNKPFFNQVSYLAASKSTQITQCVKYISTAACCLVLVEVYYSKIIAVENTGESKSWMELYPKHFISFTAVSWDVIQSDTSPIMHKDIPLVQMLMHIIWNASHQPLFQKIPNGCHSSRVLNACWGTSVSSLLLALSPCFHVRLC